MACSVWSLSCGTCAPAAAADPRQPKAKSVLRFSQRASLLASRLDRVVRGRRQDRRPVRRTFFFCTSNSEVKIAGEAAETGTDPDSRATVAVKYFVVSPSRRSWSARASGVPTISTPRTFVRPAVRVNLVDHQGSTWNACGCPRPVNVKPPAMSSINSPNGLPCALINSNQLGAEFCVAHRLAALHDQVALPRNRRCAELPPAVSVRTRKANQRRPRHLEIL